MMFAVDARVVPVVVLVVCACVYAGPRVDPLFRARCLAACTRQPNKIKCEAECGLGTKSKPGKCPEEKDLTWYEKSCVKACSHDVECPGTEKCCRHGCGTTCQHAVNLEQEQGIPPIPSNLTVSDTSRQRAKLVQWTEVSAVEGEVVYVLQQRSHVGQSHDPQNFGPWRHRSRRRRNKQMLTGLTPAHWYQVRVAAVNANGSRGYSPPSPPFSLQIAPKKPEDPHNLTVLRPGWVDGRLWAELRWRRASSDLPLHHYRVFWSHCARSEPEDSPGNPCKPKSVIVNHKTVNYRNTTFLLKDLEPHSLYFIQVQAVTIPFGNKKLSSDKAVVFIDTNKLKNATYNWKVHPERAVSDLRVLNFYRTTPEKLEARVVWEASSRRFLVKWNPHPSCKTVHNNFTTEATTEEVQYDIDNLEFNCKYQVSVNPVNSAKTAKITITTPRCQEVPSKLSCS